MAAKHWVAPAPTLCSAGTAARMWRQTALRVREFWLPAVRGPRTWAKSAAIIAALGATCGAPGAFAVDAPPCGDTGVWIQILGAGGPELNDGSSASSYLVWLDNRARLLVGTAPGASVRFDEAGARFEDLDAIVLTHLHADHSADFPSFIVGSRDLGRERPLTVLGPEGGDSFPDTKTFVDRMIGPAGAFPYLADFLTRQSSGGYRLRVWNVPARGRHRWAGFATEHVRLAAIPVHHGGVPSLAWRVEAAGKTMVFAGDFSNQKDLVAEFARDVDALVVSHAVPETARPAAREWFAVPSKLGRIAGRADARMLVLGHRTLRTRGRETQSREAIEKQFAGPIIFADDLECWGL